MIKKTMLAAALAAFAFTALPAMASANPILDLTSGQKHFTVSGGAAKLEAGTPVNCSSVTGTGEFEETEAESGVSQTGTIQFTFHSCKEGVFNTSCTTGSDSAGTITTTVLPFHLVTTSDGPAVLITPAASGWFAHFTCFFHTIKITVGGNGIIGTLTEPEYKEESDSFEVVFGVDEEGNQAHTTVLGSEEEYGLESEVNEGEPEPAVEVATGTGTFTNGEKATLTEG